MATSDFQVGDIVRCEREAPAKGTWRNYAGRVGRVVVPDNDGEIGLTWQVEKTLHRDQVDSWFLPSELVPTRQGWAEGAHKRSQPLHGS